VQPVISNAWDNLALDQGYYYDEKPLYRPIRKWIETYLVQSKAPFDGKPLKLIDWQIDYLRRLYSWWRVDTGIGGEPLLRYDFATVFIPKKQGKSTLCAAQALAHLVWIAGSEVAVVASTTEQAAVVFSQSADFCENHEALQELDVRRYNKTILDHDRKSKLFTLSGDIKGKSGFNLSFCVYDEFLEVPADRAAIIWARLRAAGAARVNSIQVMISTANYCEPSHVGLQQFIRARDLQSCKGEPDLNTLAIVYALDNDKDYTDENNWWDVLPSVGKTTPKSFYRQKFKQVKDNPRELADFRVFQLNQFIGTHPDCWVPADKWEACNTQFKEEDLWGSDCIIGVDMSRRFALSSYVVIIHKGEDYFLLPRFYLPQELAAQKQKTDNCPYLQWEKLGFVRYTPGDVIDPASIREGIMEDAKHFNIIELRYDRYGFEESRQILETNGIVCTEVLQIFGHISHITAWFERLVNERRIKHNGNPCMATHVANAIVKVDNQNRIMLSKRSSTGYVDGVAATLTGLTALYEIPEGEWTGAFVM
jgi:phage terminase large subunit-like protein